MDSICDHFVNSYEKQECKKFFEAFETDKCSKFCINNFICIEVCKEKERNLKNSEKFYEFFEKRI